MGEAQKPALVDTILEADMDDHAVRQLGKARTYSMLDWPTPETLAEANRLRAQAFKEMVVDGSRWLRHWVGAHLFAMSRSKASPAKVRIAGRR